MDTKRLQCFVVLSFLTFALTPSSLLAQQQYGQLQIQVVDQTQAVMPGAPVELTSPALMRPITGTADGRGMFIATTLPPGLYTITVRATGFRAAVVENVTVEVGRTYSVEITSEV
ncbi:MAG: carboxypeptidase-like regulatory domain-containing protein, partial [Acidimicrobiia bacterium]